MEKIGTIFVDAGCVMVGDPCYTQGADASHGSTSWNDFLAATWPDVFRADGTVNHDVGMADVAVTRGEQGIGIVVSSGYGDGEYPVYIERNDEGRISRLVVDFIEDELDEALDLEEQSWRDEQQAEYDEQNPEPFDPMAVER